MREAIASRTVLGSSVTPCAPSATDAASSSMNSGFPSATSINWRTVASDESPSVAVATAAASSADNGSSGIVVCESKPAPQVGRVSRSSGRASARNATGTSRTWVVRYSMSSSWLVSAQWTSSNTSTVGRSVASPSTSRRTAKNIGVLSSDWSPLPRPSRSDRYRPISSTSPSATSVGSVSINFVRAAAGASLSRIPATRFTCSALVR